MIYFRRDVTSANEPRACACFSFSHPPHICFLFLTLLSFSLSLLLSPYVSISLHPPPSVSRIYIHIYIHSCYLPTSRPVSTALPPRPAHKYKSWIIDSKANVGEYCAIGGKPLFTTRARPDERTNNASVCGFPPLLYESYRIYRFRVLHRFEKSFEPR